MKRSKAATLAVGTEVTDGQIVDANSAWISQKLVASGIEILEHRAVADDRPEIERALLDLMKRVDLLFVTGGLGPTSDDFTREVIAKVYARALDFDPASWKHVEETLASRGVPAREIQRVQCCFPRGARVLTNPAGTANAFVIEKTENTPTLYALPGPPSEISAVWEAHLAAEIGVLVPANERESLLILRFLGRGESQIAEVVEEMIDGKPLRVGYRAHVPYVEVKLWSFPRDAALVAPVLAGIEAKLAAWLVNRNGEDVADPLLNRAKALAIHIEDTATGGLLAERLMRRIRETAAEGLKLSVETRWSPVPTASTAPGVTSIRLEADESSGNWLLRLKTGKSGEIAETVLEEKPLFNYKLSSERARRYITEKALILLKDRL